MRHLPELEPGTQLGPYVISDELGRGGIAVVYRAQHSTLPSQGALAIKVAFRTNEQRDKRFIREFERLRVIAIPGVARVYEAGATEDLLWYAMDEIPGISMDRQIASSDGVEGRVQTALETGARLMDVLAGIHRLGFIHRDIKPSNVLVDTTNGVHVLDFGLVRLKERGDTLTRTGRLVGTVAFMSPEQTTGLPLTSGTDIFSAALVLYEGLVGPRQRPHRQEEWLGRMCLQRVVPLCIVNPRIPRGLSSLVDRMLALDPHARPSASECAAAFRELAHGRGQLDWPDPPEFVGREKELDALVHAFDPGSPPLQILSGPTGSGRRRLLEQVQRRALLYGTPRITGQCIPEVSGGAVLAAMLQLLATRADPEWRAKITDTDAAYLMAMWPTLPLTAPPPSTTTPTLEGVAHSVAATLKRAVDTNGLMLVIEDLDQVDGLTARVVQALVDDPPERMAVFATYDDRWATDRSKRLVSSLSEKGKAMVRSLPDLTTEQASALAGSLVPDSVKEGIEGGSPQRAREVGLRRLAHRLGEGFPQLPASSLPLGIARRPLPREVLALLDIDPEPLLESGIIVQDGAGLYSLTGEALKRNALALIPDRRSAEDALADALTRGGMGAERWRDVATHMLRGRRPYRALGPAIQAAVHAAHSSNFDEARCWLMAIDPMPRDRSDPTYQALRFELSWCRARTSLATDLARIREDLVDQAQDRARTDDDHARVAEIKAILRVRQDRADEALALCAASAKGKWAESPALSDRFALRAARIHLNQGRHARVPALLAAAGGLTRTPEHALAQADLATLQGDVQGCINICRAGIAHAHAPDQAAHRANLALRLGSALEQSGDRPSATQAIYNAGEVLHHHGHRAHIAEADVRAADLALGRGHPSAARILLDPVIAITRSFGLLRIQAEAWRLKLAIATTVGDKAAARAAKAGWNKNYRGDDSGWVHANARWHWAEKDLDKALAAAEAPFSLSAAGTHLAIDRAHMLLCSGDRAEASRVLGPALDHATSNGLHDLSLLGSLVAGAIAPEQDEAWAGLLRQARSNPWMELSLMCLALDGRRRMAMGDQDLARKAYSDLHNRAHHLGDELKISVANLGLRTC